MNRIKYFRQKNEMTVRDLADKAKIAIGYISELENDEEGSRNPSRSVMLSIAEALGQTIPEVFFPDEHKEVI